MSGQRAARLAEAFKERTGRDPDGAYADRRAACQAAAAVLGVPALRDATPEQVEAAAGLLGDPGLRRARHVVTENARVLAAVGLLRAGDLDRLGPLLASSHASLRDDYEVSSPELDAAVEAAVDAGAIGARMTGAGFGGSALALVPAGLLDQVEAGLRAAGNRHSRRTLSQHCEPPCRSDRLY